jgi:16S rRNA (adenine1518-N6/adenine1519-N6)-dimethyltransferase
LPRPFGQHFLRSPDILERIASAAAPEGGEPLLLEIGPGKGALTRLLLPRVERLISIEVDPAMIAHLEKYFSHETKLEIVKQDVLEVDLAQWGRCAIAGNLPYYITSPIVSRVFAAYGCWSQAVFLVQKEVADRMAAPPGSRDYGYLSVETQVYADAQVLFGVPPDSFSPPPKVDSAVILLTPRQVDREAERPFLTFAGRCFAMKRKMLRNNLNPFYPKDLVDAQPEASLRAEQLSIPQLRDLFARLSSGARMLS